MDRNQRLFLQARPPRAQVAIVFNPLSYMVGGRQRAATSAGPQSEVGSIDASLLAKENGGFTPPPGY